MSEASPPARLARLALEPLRYLAVVVVGLGIDIGVGYGAHRLLGLPLVAGAALGFLVGVAANYVLFEFWVFRTGRLSWPRLGKAYVAAQAALLVRLGSVWVLGHLLAGFALFPLITPALLTLTAAAGLSFVVNFVLVRMLLKAR